MNSRYLIERFLEIHYEIEDSFWKKTSFQDKDLEKKFRKENNKFERKMFPVYNLIVILGYIATLLYIFFAFYKLTFLIICSCCFILTIISIHFSNRTENRKFKLILNHIQIFLSSFNLWSKSIIICIFYNTHENDNIEELLRVIIYEFVSTNIFIIVKMEADYRMSLFYFFLSLMNILFCQFYSNKNHYFFLEIITSFFVSSIFFALRKEWDLKLRKIFSQKYKFERTYEYIQEYLIGLNGHSLNVKNGNNFYINEKMSQLINKVHMKNYDDYIFRKIQNKFYNLREKIKENDKPDEFIKFKIIRNDSKIQSNEESKLFRFFDELILIDKEVISLGKSNKELNLDNQNLSGKSITLLDYIICEYFEKKKHFETKKNKTRPEKLSFFQKIKQFSSKGKTFFSENITIDRSDIHQIIRDRNFQSKLIETSVEIKLKNNSSYYSPNNKNDLIENLSKNLLIGKKDLPAESFFYLNNPSIKFMEDYKEKNNLLINKNNSLGKFSSIGKFYYKNEENSEKLYFDISRRSINLGYNHILEDYFIFDITELIVSEGKLFEENLKKQKIYAKISHEFKTPLNSIISLIDSMEISEENHNQKNSKNFKIIKNLSNYLVFLIADIIQYSQITEINQIPLNKKNIEIKNLIYFCDDILKTLIESNKSKRKNIITSIYIDDLLESINIQADEIRLKQVILNFISNAVKFTREGEIKIGCKLKEISSERIIKIYVKDTGIGIKDEEKDFIGKDFSLINKNLNFLNNQIGSGLGLSISKSLVELMGFKLEFKSKFMHGSKFSILIPSSKTSIKDQFGDKLSISTFQSNNNSLLSENKFFKKSLFFNIKPKKSYEDLNNFDFKSELNISSSVVQESQKSFRRDIRSNLKSTLRTSKLRSLSPRYRLKNNDSKSIISIFTKSTLAKNKLNFEFTYIFNEKLMSDPEMFNHSRTQLPKPIILIVEDNEIIQNSNKRIILQILKEKNLDYEVILLDDGLDVIKLILNYEKNYEFIKFIITDENMEYFNGSDTIKFIRKFEEVKNLKKITIYSLTCHENKEMMEKIINCGANGILLKPLSKSALQGFLENHFV